MFRKRGGSVSMDSDLGQAAAAIVAAVSSSSEKLPAMDYAPPQSLARPDKMTITLNGTMLTVPSSKTILSVCRCLLYTSRRG